MNSRDGRDGADLGGFARSATQMALGHQSDNLNAKIDRYRALSNEDLLYKYSRVSYLFERAVERMEPSDDLMEDMNLMRVVLLDRLSTIPILRQHRVITAASADIKPERTC